MSSTCLSTCATAASKPEAVGPANVISGVFTHLGLISDWHARFTQWGRRYETFCLKHALAKRQARPQTLLFSSRAVLRRPESGKAMETTSPDANSVVPARLLRLEKELDCPVWR
ncbi:hypothetical protein V2G26_009869 [Clonostachys chloroleuca]